MRITLVWSCIECLVSYAESEYKQIPEEISEKEHVFLRATENIGMEVKLCMLVFSIAPIVKILHIIFIAFVSPPPPPTPPSSSMYFSPPPPAAAMLTRSFSLFPLSLALHLLSCFSSFST